MQTNWMTFIPPMTALPRRAAAMPLTPVMVQDVAAVRFAAKQRTKADYPLVIVGGGVAGMTAAYLAQKYGIKALLLEAKPDLGGNAAAGVNEDGIPHPRGASVMAIGDQRQLELLQELGLPLNDPRFAIQKDIAYFNGEWVSVDLDKKQSPFGTWFATEVDKAVKFLFNLLGGANGSPSFPLRHADAKLFDLDDPKSNFRNFLMRFPKPVRQFFEVNFRSDVSEHPGKVSPLAGIIDQGADQGERYRFPKGNFSFIEKVVEKVHAAGAQKLVDIRAGVPVTKIEEKKNLAKVTFTEGGKSKTVTAERVLLAIPSHRMPEVLDMPVEKAKFLKSIKRGAYAMLNISLKESPLQSSTYYKFPYATWVADIVQTNKNLDPYLQPGSKVPSVLTCYVPIPRNLIKAIPKQEEEFKEKIMEEIFATMPEVEPLVKSADLKFYEESMSAPRPGQMKKMRDFDRHLTNHVWSLHSDLSGVFAFRGAVDEAYERMETIRTEIQDQSKAAGQAP